MYMQRKKKNDWKNEEAIEKLGKQKIQECNCKTNRMFVQRMKETGNPRSINFSVETEISFVN